MPPGGGGPESPRGGGRVGWTAGERVVREPIASRHAGTVTRLTRLWTSRLGERAVVQIQNPIELPTEDSEPQPDVTLLRPRADFYTGAHPVAADVLLLIEVADSTLAVDRRVRMPLYARAAIPEAWILDLTADRVEVYRAPAADGYQRVVTLERGQRLTPGAFPDLIVTVEDLLG